MSDKSFGDHINKNVVKNSLLSSSVLGLSLEDLTHKAVLLPASPSQGQVTRLDQQQGPQTHTLAYSDHDKQSFPSGDAFTNISLSNTPNLPPSSLDSENNDNVSNTRVNTTASQSKASAKSDDDFDVNEYIARLQGTRYVSAPLNSKKEDQNANLNAEEALEEINLNEARVEPVQSLTADIAQNFSQLPAVLPHMASAVFSSFSNMLSMKSREQTPERYQEVQLQPDSGVPLMGMEDVTKDFGPPPKEPPVTGTSNYRITSKKKYAQIPGLSYGGTQNVYQNPITPFTSQPFVPLENNTCDDNVTQNTSLFTPANNTVVRTDVFSNTDVDRAQNDMNVDIIQGGKTQNTNVPQETQSTTIDYKDITTPRVPIIPPPPMFSNPRTATQGVGKSVLPPSVARRISANQPLIKTMPAPVFTDNIFVPTMPDSVPETSLSSASSIQPHLMPAQSSYSSNDTSLSVETILTTKTESVGFLNTTGTKSEVFPSPSSVTQVLGVEPTITGNLQPFEASTNTANVYSTGSIGLNSLKSGFNVPASTQPVEAPTNAANVFSDGTLSNAPSVKNQSNTFVQMFSPQASNTVPSNIPSSIRASVANVGPSSSASLPPNSTPFVPSSASSASQPIADSFPLNIPASYSAQPSTVPIVPMFAKSLQSSQSIGDSFPSANVSAFTNSAPPPNTVPIVPMFTPPTQSSLPIGESFPSNIPASYSVPQPSNTAPFVPMFPPTQPTPIFTPPQDLITQTPEVIAEAKPLIEPPKATGMNFRMTKKRPQYYSGPIEGVGAISNNVKPVITPVMPPVPSNTSAFQGTFFTPEHKESVELTAPIDHGHVPFDIIKPVEPVANAFEAKPQVFNTIPQQYPQEFNTAFDLSRTATDAYEEPKQEPKGFGIIGSLKSKLSSIDINKLQSTVTTFFDPAYNIAKGEPALQTEPYAQQQYGQHSQDQSNFEVTVPGVYENQYNQYNQYSYDQNNQYYQAQNAYHQSGQNTSGYFTEASYQQQVYNPASNTNAHEYRSTNYTQENIPQNVENVSDNFEVSKKTQVPLYYPTTVPEHSRTKHEDAMNYPQPAFANPKLDIANAYVSPNVGTHGAIGDVAVKATENPSFGIDQSFKQNDQIPKAANFLDNPPIGTDETKPKSYDNTTANETVQSRIQFNAPLPPAMSFFDSPTASIQETKPKEIVDEIEKLAMAEEIAIARSPLEDIDLQIGVNKPHATKTTKVDHGITAISLDKNVKNFHINKEQTKTDQKGLSLVESLSIDTTPVVAVSSAPLFGLSAVIDTKQEPIENVESTCLYEASKEIKPILENKAFSLFGNTAEKANEEPSNVLGLSIADVKNVLLIEPPQDNLGAILQQTASLSSLKDPPEAEVKNIQNLSKDRDSSWHFDKSMVTSKDNVNLLFDRKASGFFDHLSEHIVDKNVQEDTDATEQASNFNICETCREVTSPDIKENDTVTNKLIENMNSSIQLSNPVETVLTESIPTATDRAFEEKQFDDINRITEDTIETLQGQSACELLDDNPNNNYGWNTEQLAYASIAAIDKEFVNNTSIDPNYNLPMNPEYMFKIDQNAIGFFGDNSLFFDNVPKNASDEIKAELKTHDDVLPRQMSLPSAPPAEEDDTKSDETGGLDVLSIEQDAKKDFPLEEEFIIEPSETDDDKIEFRERKKSSEDSTHDTFAGRIEKFKNKAGTEFSSTDDIYQTTGMNPPKSMASYFDTGNYAVETHFRKSLTSPTNLKTFQDQLPMNTQEKTVDPIEDTSGLDEAFRLPPGFEDEIRRQLLGQNSSDYEPFIPETQTQTRLVETTTYSTVGAQEFHSTGLEDALLQTMQAKADAYTKDTPFTEIKDVGVQEFYNTNLTNMPVLEMQSKDVNRFTEVKKDESPETLTLEKAFGSTNTIIKGHTEVLAKVNPNAEPITQNLPDPINFFAQNEAKEAVAAPEDFNRLASYFTMPTTQPDHSKSFFELSQSQNHYRHVSNDISYQHYDNKTRENLQNLMNDLTSTQNINKVDAKPKTVNYFSVEYDNVINKPKIDFSIPKLDNSNAINDINIDNLDSLKLKSNVEITLNNNNTVSETDNNDIKTINACKYCCHTKITDVKDFKVKTAADSENRAEKDGNISEKDSDSHKKSVSLDFGKSVMDEEAQDGVAVVHENRSSSEYTPVRHHWFYRVDVDDKSLWRGFSTTDSNALEQKYLSADLTEDTLVPTDGGRFDVNIIGRLRIAVYWKEKPTNVRRCSWFYKGTTDARYVPYTEAVADKLEEEYRHGVTTGEWHRRLVLPNSELVVMHGPSVMVHFLHGGADTFSSPPFLFGKRVYRNPPKIRVSRDLRPVVDHLIMVVHGAGEYKKAVPDDTTSRPRVVRRGCEESEIEDPEPSSIDHLLLLCHGVGSACDMRFRPVEEVVEDFRATSLQLLQSHYRNSYDNGVVSRVEVLPISWHAQLHLGEDGVDKRLNKITLESIPRLRAFTNHTVLDALFYTSPAYHQTIIDTVCFELNRIYNLFKQRNPDFKGGVSLGGHSLGSVILYDLLCHQTPEKPIQPKSSAQKTYLPGTSQPLDSYPQLKFLPSALYALGSPIAIFECIRGVEALGMNFALPTCKNFFNIFHPYDPIAYRIEPLINPSLQDAKPFLIPHHKGRKRMHLELKDTMVRVGADLKQKLIESLRTTWNKWKATPPPDGQLEKVIEEEMEKEQLCDETKEEVINPELGGVETLGNLNDGRRVDYVLQEAPLEMINEYLFAMSSHVGYWESEDTMLLMLREIYSALGVQPDSTVPQQSMTVTRTRLDEATIVNEKEYPSTSRGSSN